MKRKPKTDEQLYVEWASDIPNWLEDMPLNKKNLEIFKKTLSYQRMKIDDAFGVFADELCETPAFKALKEKEQ